MMTVTFRLIPFFIIPPDLCLLSHNLNTVGLGITVISPVFWGWRCHSQVVSHYNFLLLLCIKQWIKKFYSNRHLNFTVIVEIFFLPAVCLHLYGSSSFTIHNNLPTIVTEEQETICLHLGCWTDLNSEQHFANRSTENGKCWYLHSVPICKWVERWHIAFGGNMPDMLKPILEIGSDGPFKQGH